MMTIEELREARQAACRIKEGYADTEGERKIADVWCDLIDAEIERQSVPDGMRGGSVMMTDLLYKESAMKPVDKEIEYACGQCDTHVAYNDDYCWHCGQKLDWSEE